MVINYLITLKNTDYIRWTSDWPRLTWAGPGLGWASYGFGPGAGLSLQNGPSPFQPMSPA